MGKYQFCLWLSGLTYKLSSSVVSIQNSMSLFVRLSVLEFVSTNCASTWRKIEIFLVGLDKVADKGAIIKLAKASEKRSKLKDISDEIESDDEEVQSLLILYVFWMCRLLANYSFHTCTSTGIYWFFMCFECADWFSFFWSIVQKIDTKAREGHQKVHFQHFDTIIKFLVLFSIPFFCWIDF